MVVTNDIKAGIKVLYLDWRLVISTNIVGYRTMSAFLLKEQKGFFYTTKRHTSHLTSVPLLNLIYSNFPQ